MLRYENFIPVLTTIENLFETLTQQFPNLNFIRFKIGDNESIIFESEIIIADETLITPYLKNLKQVKWIQTTWAGINHFISGIRDVENFQTTVTRYSGERTGISMAEFLIASITIYERSMYQMREDQKRKFWSKTDSIAVYRNLMDLKIGILGFGAIGSKVAQLLKEFGCEIWALCRQNKKIDPNVQKVVDKYIMVNDLKVLLEHCDYIINMLPSTNETRGLLGGGVLQSCSIKPTVFINVGRGNIINENDLIDALNRKWISAAILDVFEEEPLPKTSRLWDMSNVYITSHIASEISILGIAKVFGDNLKLYLENKPLKFVVDFKNGY